MRRWQNCQHFGEEKGLNETLVHPIEENGNPTWRDGRVGEDNPQEGGAGGLEAEKQSGQCLR